MNTKECVRMYGIAEYDDGNIQILISNDKGEIIGTTHEFPRHDLKNMLSVFFDSGIEDRLEKTFKLELVK